MLERNILRLLDHRSAGTRSPRGIPVRFENQRHGFFQILARLNGRPLGLRAVQLLHAADPSLAIALERHPAVIGMIDPPPAQLCRSARSPLVAHAHRCLPLGAPLARPTAGGRGPQLQRAA